MKGSVMIYSVLILAIIISIAISLVSSFVSKIRTSSDVIKSAVAIYAADSALEWCLYKNRGNLNPPALPPTITTPTGVTTQVYFGAGIATCDITETPLNHRSVGTYLEISRSLEITE